jgi:hypothetical protein
VQGVKTLLRTLEKEEQERYMVVSNSQLYISQEGDIHPKTFTRPGPGRRYLIPTLLFFLLRSN